MLLSNPTPTTTLRMVSTLPKALAGTNAPRSFISFKVRYRRFSLSPLPSSSVPCIRRTKGPRTCLPPGQPSRISLQPSSSLASPSLASFLMAVRPLPTSARQTSSPPGNTRRRCRPLRRRLGEDCKLRRLCGHQQDELRLQQCVWPELRPAELYLHQFCHDGRVHPTRVQLQHSGEFRLLRGFLPLLHNPELN